MPKPLNAIDDEGHQWAIDHARKLIRLRRSVGQLWTGHFDLATHVYQQDGSLDEVRASFLHAVEPGLRMFEEREKPEPGGRIRTPWDFGLVLGVVCAFGSVEQQGRAGRVERWKWFAPESPEYLLLADTFETLQQYLGGRFDLEAAEGVVRRCSAANADRDAVRFNAPLVRALIGLHRRDASTVNEGIAAMVEEHMHRALHGSLQAQAEGLVAVLPLGLVRLAREAGLDLQLDSPYVPIQLL